MRARLGHTTMVPDLVIVLLQEGALHCLVRFHMLERKEIY
jgi:hypothetical protein